MSNTQEGYRSDIIGRAIEISQSAPSPILKVMEFVKAVNAGEEPPCSGFIGRQILEVLFGTFESVRMQGRVRFPVLAEDFPLKRQWRSVKFDEGIHSVEIERLTSSSEH